MAQLLLRDVPEETKRALKIRAAKNGRSQNAEAVAILEDALRDEKEPWIRMLGRESDRLGGVELDIPPREPARDFHFEE